MFLNTKKNYILALTAAVALTAPACEKSAGPTPETNLCAPPSHRSESILPNPGLDAEAKGPELLVEATPRVTEEILVEATPPIAEKATATADATPPAKEATATADATPPVKEATPPAKEATPPAKEATPPAKEATLLLDGTDPIPEALIQRYNQYTKVRKARLVAVSDDASQLMIRTRFGETIQVHAVRQPMGARTQLTFDKEPIRTPVSFVPGNNRAIVYLGDTGGDEENRLYRLDLDTGHATLLSGSKGRVEWYAWSRDGKQLAYGNNARNSKDVDVYVCDGKDPSSARLLVEASGEFNPIDWSQDGSKLLVLEYRSITDSQLHVVDVATGERKKVTEDDPKASYRLAIFGQTSNELFVASDRGGEYVKLFKVDLTTGVWAPMTEDLNASIEDSLTLSSDGRLIAFLVNEEGYRSLHLVDTTTGQRRRVESLPKGIMYALSFARDKNILAFSFANEARTTDAYTYNTDTDELIRWTDSEVGGLDTSKFLQPSLIRYKSFDGLEIPAFYFRPPGDGPFPVLIDIHGGPESQARSYFKSIYQYFVLEMGVAILIPNVRGSDGYGKTYLTLDNGKKREDSVKDIGALLDWVAAQPELDATHVGVTGNSYGGYMVLAALTHYSDRLVAGADKVGISNFVTFLENTKGYRRDLRRLEYGDESDPEMRAFLEAISPMNNVDKIDAALFVAHGANDPRVPASEAEQIVKQVRAKGQDVWFMLARNEGHSFRRRENKDTFELLQILFFEKHLLKGPGKPLKPPTNSP